MLDSDLSAILLAKKGPDSRALLLACGMSGDVIGDGEKHERVELNVKPRVRGLLGKEGFCRLHRNIEGMWRKEVGEVQVGGWR